MKKFSTTLIFILISSFAANSLSAQVHEILDWDFFSNGRPRGADSQAFTWSTLSYRYRILDGEANSSVIKFEVNSKADPDKSYFEKARRLANDIQLLKHEQGHADIVYIAALRLKQELEQTSFLVETVEEASGKIFDRVLFAMQNEQKKYDLETNHSNNLAGQKRWDLYFKKIIDTGIPTPTP